MMTMRPPGPLLDGLREFVQTLPAGCTVVEIGSYRGESAREFLQRASKIWCVDPWAPFMDRSNRVPSLAPEMAEVEKEFDEFASEFPGRVVKIKSRSLDARSQFTPQSVDVVYIDGLHDRRSVIRDILAWRDVPNICGLLAGHDYGHPGFPGVAQAVAILLQAPDCVFKDGTWIKRKPCYGLI
jgi:hypothetical protein